MARMSRLVEAAALQQSSMETLVTRFARVYTPVIIAVCLAVAFVPWAVDGRENKVSFAAAHVIKPAEVCVVGAARCSSLLESACRGGLPLCCPPVEKCNRCIPMLPEADAGSCPLVPLTDTFTYIHIYIICCMYNNHVSVSGNFVQNDFLIYIYIYIYIWHSMACDYRRESGPV